MGLPAAEIYAAREVPVWIDEGKYHRSLIRRFLSDGQSPAGELPAGLSHPVERDPALEPARKLDEPLFERYPGLVAEHLLRERDIGEAVPYVAHPVFPVYLRGYLLAEYPAHPPGYLEDGAALSASDVERRIGGLLAFESERARGRHVADVHEVPLLQAVFVYERRFSVQEPCRKDGEHACVRV